MSLNAGKTIDPRRRAGAFLAALLIGLAGPAANAAVNVLGVQYQQDRLHPEFNCIWDDSAYPNSCPTVSPGANVHVYLKNAGPSQVMVTNVTLAGYDLKTIIQEKVEGQNDAYSIYYYWDNPPQAIFNAGEPVWFRVDPTNLPPGAVFQVVVRLRQVPVTQPASVGVQTDDGATVTANITVDANAPQLASVSFSPDLDKVYLHWRRNGGAVPTSVWMDGVNVTATTVTVGDAGASFAESAYTPAAPLPYMSYHVFQGAYADGKTATASLRAWVNKFNYGTYGSGPTTNWNDARAWIDDCVNRGVNCLIYNGGTDGLVGFLNKDAGQEYAGDRGYGFVVEHASEWNTRDPRMWYLRDEPDAHDWALTRRDDLAYDLPEDGLHSTGVLAMREVFNGDGLHYAQGEITPTTVNVDGTHMPYNYYTYGQLADVGMTDPYYQRRMSTAYWTETNTIPLYQKATYIYAVAQAMTESSEPNPANVILYSKEYHDDNDPNIWWPYPQPGTKRIEAYYALAGGAKGMGYWWMLGADGFGQDIADGRPEATALWKEIGLLGNEFRTAQPLIVISHPAALTTAASANVWAKPLLAGIDSVLLVVINDCYTNDFNGFHYTPVGNATVTVTLPSYIAASPTSFEIAAGAEGVKDVSTALNGNQLQVNLGTLDVTRLIVVTTNAQLRATIQRRYLEKSYQGVCAIAPEHRTAQPACILNADAEGGFRSLGGGSIANNWYEFEGPYGTNVTGFDETAIVHSGSHSQHLRLQVPGGGSGGVYQRIPATPGAPYTVSVWTYAGQTTTSCYLGVDPAGGTDPTSGVTWSSANSTLSWVQKSVAATATANFLTVYYKVSSTTGVRDGYFDDASPACVGPSITQQPSALTNCAGGAATFSAAAAGSGAASYQWQRSGVNLTDTGHYSGVTTSTLTVSGLDSSDVGSYGCVVTTSYGAVNSSAAALTVRAATAFTQQPLAHDVFPGSNTTFSVVAVGDGTLTYQWQKNRADLVNGGHYSGCTTATLAIGGADASDVANYRCVVSGGCGAATSFQAALALATLPPAITGQPSPQNIWVGANATFSVVASGGGILTYQWQQNSANLSNGGHYSGSTTATLTITGVDANDVAGYRCVVANACGTTNSVSAALTLITCSPGVPLRHGNMEDASNYSVCPDWQSYTAGFNAANSSWAKQTTYIHGGSASQECHNGNGGANSVLGVRQTIDANVGDAFTFEGWVRPASNPGLQQVAMVAQWDGSTANPVAGSGTWVINTGANLVWSQVTNLAGNATSTSVTLFLDSRRKSNSDISAYWDDVVSYRAFVPPAPAVSGASGTSLNVSVIAGCNLTNTAAEYALSIGGGAYTLGTHWVQANGSVGTTAVWQSQPTWATRTVTGLVTGTAYTFKVQARYSSAYPQPTSLGAGATLAPVAAQPPQLLVQRNGNSLTLTWAEPPTAQLQQAGSLTRPVSWAATANQGSLVGGQKSVTLTPTGSAAYYRLVLQ